MSDAPKIIDAPDTIWLNYGDIERDCTHAECYREGDVTWCQEPVFDSDVKYVRADDATLARIAELEAEWRRECDDADKIMEKIGLTIEQARTDGGSLKVAFICNHIQETLDALAATQALQIDTFNKMVRLERENAALQARIDELMLEHCPDEMSQEQIDNYAKHQRPVSAEEEAAVDAALKENGNE